MLKRILIISLSILFFTAAKTQSFYDLGTIQEVEVYFTQPNWDYMMDTAKAGAEGYILAQWVKINGVQIDSVGVKYKGNSSYSVNKIKNPLHIELDHFLPDNEYEGYTDIKLGNGFKDPTFIREVLSYQLVRNYMPAPLSNFAKLYINGDYIGLYSNTESITKKFVTKHFYSNTNTFFKCNPIYSTNGKSNLAFLGVDSSLYFNSYEIKSNYGWNDMVHLCDVIKNNPNNINTVLDIDRALWMLAIDNVMVNLDSYIGGICQNYYLYKSDNGSFNTIIWDLNESFGCFNNTGEGSPLNMQQMQEMSPWLHLNNNLWPLIQRLLFVPQYKRMYMAHYRTFFEEYFINDHYLPIADTLRLLIDSDVQTDANKMYSYTQFQNGMTSNITSGMFIPGIKLLMDGRKNYLNGLIDFQHIRPDINTPVLSDTLPDINDTIFVTAQVNNATEVFLGYRYAKESRFIRKQMFDDGMHGDGAPNDGIYGCRLAINSTMTHYYIYAENANAGRFLPPRAEYEYFVVNSNIQYIFNGQLVINELMAINNNTITDAANQYSDWIELYNTSADTLNLSNLCISDNYNIPYKWKFPDNTHIAPNDYLIVWANDDTTSSGLNTPFKLSGNGERLIISYENGVVLDSITFPQQTTDISYGRYPNGTGSFTFMYPTPSAMNIISSISEISLNYKFLIYPNPVDNILNIEANDAIKSVEIYNIIGHKHFAAIYENANKVSINTSSYSKGVFFLKINNNYSLKFFK